MVARKAERLAVRLVYTCEYVINQSLPDSRGSSFYSPPPTSRYKFPSSIKGYKVADKSLGAGGKTTRTGEKMGPQIETNCLPSFSHCFPVC